MKNREQPGQAANIDPDLAGSLARYGTQKPVPEERALAWEIELRDRPKGNSRRGAETQRLGENDIGTLIVDAALRIHRALGPGLLESVYEVVLAHELRKRGLTVERQVAIPIEYDGLSFEEGFRADLVVEWRVIVEIKAVERLNNAHKKQLLTYLRLTGCKLGYLLNFSEALMKDGIHRVVNALPE